MRYKKIKKDSKSGNFFAFLVSILLIVALVSSVSTALDYNSFTENHSTKSPESVTNENFEQFFYISGQGQGHGLYASLFPENSNTYFYEEFPSRGSQLGFLITDQSNSEFCAKENVSKISWVSPINADYLEVGHSKNGTHSKLFYQADIVSTNVYVLETDFCFMGSQNDLMSSSVGIDYIKFSFCSDIKSDASLLSLYICENPGVSYYSFSSSENGYTNSYLLREGEWYNLCIKVIPLEENDVQLILYVNGMEIENKIVTLADNVSFDTFTYGLIHGKNSVKDMVFYLDNTTVLKPSSTS